MDKARVGDCKVLQGLAAVVSVSVLEMWRVLRWFVRKVSAILGVLFRARQLTDWSLAKRGHVRRSWLQVCRFRDMHPCWTVECSAYRNWVSDALCEAIFEV